VNRFHSISKSSKIAVFCIVASIFSILLVVSEIDRSSIKTLFSIEGFILHSSWHYSHWIGYAATGAVFIIGYLLIRNAIFSRTSIREVTIGKNIVFILSLTSLTQLFPFYDLWHLWFITPVLVVGLLSTTLFRSYVNRYKDSIELIGVLFCGIAIAVAFIFQQPLIYQYKSKILEGMKSSSPYASDLDNSLMLLSRYGDSGSIKFECPLGLYAVSDGTYMSKDLNYVNWGNFQDLNEREFRQLFVCEATKDRIETLKSQGWEMLFIQEFRKEDYGDYYITYNALFKRK
jgi:hypothetical protein